MAVSAHLPGYPRIGPSRELKRAQERFWRGAIDEAGLLAQGAAIRRDNWALQAGAGLRVTAGDFSLYDQVLDLSALLGAVPPRFADAAGGLATYFGMARGTDSSTACEMTKWFDTNYHYIVPELDPARGLGEVDEGAPLFAQVQEAREQGHEPKAVLVGPLSWLWLAKARDGGQVLDLLEPTLRNYARVLELLAQQGVDWVQVDEPILAVDLEPPWREAFGRAYAQLAEADAPRLMLASYFGPRLDNLDWSLRLPVAGQHLDLARGAADWPGLQAALDGGAEFTLSAGVIDGRSIWRANLERLHQRLAPLAEQLGERLWVAPGCSLMHLPVDAGREERLGERLRGWLSFAEQKVEEIGLLARALSQPDDLALQERLRASAALEEERKTAAEVVRPQVRQRVAALTEADASRAAPYPQRAAEQRQALGLPALPTTTIGSYPQTKEIRTCRAGWRAGRIDDDTYRAQMRSEIEMVVREQEKLGLDVLVHGEPERNDMVEYFADGIDGMAATDFGWVLSYGSRCVKPPLIYGDLERPAPITVEWIRYAASLTDRPVKGMLTGPVTMLCWSLPRDDISREEIAMQMALALRDEVRDLEAAGTGVIQIDEPALREGAPLRKADWKPYFGWATKSFRVCSSGVRDATQIHSHMCYSEFNEIVDQIAAMDADAISIEASRSDMELLRAFRDFAYPNEIGPGVYDIHSPRIPEVEEMAQALRAAGDRLAPEQLWVNPDCGLKTRNWEEVRAALGNMVEAARIVRNELQS